MTYLHTATRRPQHQWWNYYYYHYNNNTTSTTTYLHILQTKAIGHSIIGATTTQHTTTTDTLWVKLMRYRSKRKFTVESLCAGQLHKDILCSIKVHVWPFMPFKVIVCKKSFAKVKYNTTNIRAHVICYLNNPAFYQFHFWKIGP